MAPEYGDEVEPTEAELDDYTLTAQKLWDLDDNRLVTNKDYDIDVQGGKRSYEARDGARNPLFAKVSQEIWRRPTFRLLYALRDNYTTETGVAETESAQERKEISDLLDAIMDTRPMTYAHKYLVAKGLAKRDRAAFKSQLYQMWFAFYRRDGANDSCGFEHVFLGEYDVTSGEVSGFHNWVQFYVEEAKGKIDYKGYIVPRGRGEVVDDNDRILSIQFAWNGELKNVTTLFIGTSPEFEFALFSLFFLCGSERNNCEIDGYQLCIRCHAINSKYGAKIGTTFAELMADTNNNRGDDE